MNSIKGIIFDYGGTIDTNGIHWGEVIWEQYQKAGVDIDRDLYRAAYVHAERTLAAQRIIMPEDTFRTLLDKKIALQFAFLQQQPAAPQTTTEQEKEVSRLCYEKVLSTLRTTCGIVEKLSRNYPLVLVTNFYGNMPVVLKEFSLDSFFPTIIESSVVGLRKPDPQLFAMGVKATGLAPEEILVVGDSYRKDIHPARTLGCKAVWLKKVCWADEPIIPGAEPTAIIESLEELPQLLAR